MRFDGAREVLRRLVGDDDRRLAGMSAIYGDQAEEDADQRDAAGAKADRRPPPRTR